MADVPSDVASALAVQPARRWWLEVIFAVYAIVGVAGLVAVIWLLVQGITDGWQASDPERLQGAFGLALAPTILLLYGIGYWVVHPGRSWTRFRLLRELLITHSADIPEVVPPVGSLPPEDLSDTPLTFSALFRYEDRRSFASLALFGIGLATNFFSLSISRVLNNYNFGLLGIVFAPLAGVLLIVGLLSQIYPSLSKTARQRRRISITVDADGLTWSGGRQDEEQRVTWASVQAFYRLSANREVVYLLYFDGGALSWATTSTGLFPQEREAEQLAQIIVSRTGKPLRSVGELFALAKQNQTLNDQPSAQEAQANVAELLPAIATILKVKRRQNIAEFGFIGIFIAAMVALGVLYFWG